MSVVKHETCEKCGNILHTTTIRAGGDDTVETITYVKSRQPHEGCKPTSIYPKRWKEKK